MAKRANDARGVLIVRDMFMRLGLTALEATHVFLLLTVSVRGDGEGK